MTWVDRDGLAHGAVASLSGTAILSRAGAEALFAGSPKALDQAFKDAAAGKTGSLALPVEARLRTKSQNQALTSPNVIGLLRGSDPLLAPEHVVFSAHLDHLGIGTPRDGDAIYNGALDNASGVAALVEIAGAFAAQPKPPKRSILFAAVTAEEEGLLGAEYLANNPTVPGATLVANFNIDMFLSLYPLKDLIAFGGEHSSLGKLAAETAGSVGIELAPDPFPEEVIFIRSDHFPFVQKGIPAVMLCSGLRSADPKVEGKTVVGRWLATTYHSPKDDAAQPLDYGAATRIAEIYYLMASRVADDPARPNWNKGDFFGDRFGKR
jgi:Zn-dependent M28 family amino/carboxypeptidase